MTEILSHERLEPINACRLIPLDKNQGVRPIGTGEVIYRIIGITIAKNLKSELTVLGLNYELCLGKKVAPNMQFIRLGGNTRKQIPMQYY